MNPLDTRRLTRALDSIDSGIFTAMNALKIAQNEIAVLRARIEKMEEENAKNMCV